MEIKKGKINVFVGPNGSGKKEFILEHLNIKDYTDLYDVSYEDKTLDEIFDEKTKSKKKKKEALQMISMDPSLLDHSMKTFSIGELKKISIAYTLCGKSSTYLFMYPDVGLDAKSKSSLIKVFRLLKTRYHKTIIIVSTDTNWIHQFADFVFVVYNGDVVLQGSSYDIFCNMRNCKKYKIEVPKIIEFEKTVLRKKKKKIGYRNDIKDLIKDIYRNI